MTTILHPCENGVKPKWPSSSSDAAIAAFVRLGCFTRVAATWHATVDFLAPIGYEDETGFHYGEPQVRNDRAEATAL